MLTDIETAGLEILVGFKGSKPVALDAYTQSGGERTTATMSFLLALQQHVRSPFRAVDEYDIHMDPKNREMIAKVLLAIIKDANAQYVVITPSQITFAQQDANVITVQNLEGKSVVREVDIMQTIKHHKTLGKEKLERIIEMCIAIENHTVEPFTFNVDEIIKIVKEYFPHWQNPEELKLDAEALHHLATVIKMQSEWVKQRSNLLYTDPFFLEEKILQMGKQEMVDVFLKAWNPVVEFEQISLNTLAQGLLYWEALAPMGERWKDFEVAEVANSFRNQRRTC